ncbi:hypothetical protein EWM64_g7874 [Hericium alpestre]|uniref:Uncharacterized protein n=1 Tax=Hericium alpestre TaxID=135208 RepID=A0A4Y9ZPF6_9AGAM|nr:hypothetical protein EWM64_g7874 [Hericium alpestre]
MGNFQDSVDVEDFVQAIWGFKAADLKLNEWAYLPLPTALDELEVIFKEKRGETHMYRPVCELFRDAYQQAKVHLKIEAKAAIEFLHMGSTQMMAAGQNFVQPDIMGVDTEAAARLQKSGKKGPVTTIGVHLCFEGKVGTGISLNAQPQGHASMPGPRAGKRAVASKSSARHSHDPPVHTPTSTDRNPPALDEHYDAPTGSKRKAVSDTALANKARKANKSPPIFQPILDTWIVPLVNMLKDAYEAMERHKLNALADQAGNKGTIRAVKQPKTDYSQLDAFVFELEEDEDNSGAGATQDEDDDDEDDDEDDSTSNGSNIRIVTSKAEKPWNDKTLGGRMTFKKFMAVIGESPEL